MRAKSINGKSPEEIKTALQESMSDGFLPTLAIVFLSLKQHVDTIRVMLNDENIQIFGVTVTGEFTEEGVESESIVVLLLELNPDYFRIECLDMDASNVEQTANQVAINGLDIFANPAFIISGSHEQSPGHSILKGILNVAGSEATIIGGLASNDTFEEGGIVFSKDHVSKMGLICLILDQDKISVNGQAVSGWKPVGTVKTITKSEGNRIFTIDDQPALDLLIKYTGIQVNMEDTSDIFTQSYPLQVQKDKGSPIMNAPLMFNVHDRSILCGMMIPEDSKVRFSLPPDFDVIDTVIDSAKTKAKEVPDADAMIIFSCIGRLNEFGPLVNEENKGLQSIWNVPMVGFFSLGEYGKTPGGKSEFHGTTCSWMVLKEI